MNPQASVVRACLAGIAALAIAGTASGQEPPRPTSRVRTTEAVRNPALGNVAVTETATPAPSTVSANTALLHAAQPAGETSTAASPALARQYVHDVERKVNRGLLDTGKVSAIENGKRVVVDNTSLPARAARNQVFYEFARAKPTVVAVPQVLQQAAGSAAPKVATLLREDVLVPTSAGTSTRVQTFARDETGLTYVGARNRFEGRFAVALSPVEQGAAITLNAPKKISLGLPGGTLLAPVPELVIAKLDDWTPVTFSVSQPAQPYLVSVSASTGDHGDPVPVQVIQPKVNLATDRTFVPGYGLGTFIVSVSATNLQEPKGAQITFQANGGMIETGNVVTLDEHGQGRLRMRSTGSGKVVVSALPPFDGASVTVVFKNPWLLLVLAVLGGIVGAVLMRKGRAGWPKVLRNGALTGLAMTVLYYVGLDWVVKATGWTTLASAGEFVAFALGLLGVLVGIGVITAVAKTKE